MASANEIWEKKLQDPSATPMRLPLEFLKAITCHFSTKQELGSGGYGVVYKGTLPSGKTIAVKNLLHLHKLGDDKFRKEVGSLMGIKHHNVVQFLGYCAESSYEAVDLQGNGNCIFAEIPTRLLCFEHVCNESLDKYISDEYSGLKWDIRYEIIRGICHGLHYLHEQRHIVHLDLKPENILMDTSMVLKIADFGLSKIFDEKQTRSITVNRPGTLGYMAPEYILRGVVSMKADIFSLGVIMIEILTGSKQFPFDENNNLESNFQHFKDDILERWRNRLQNSQGDTVQLEQVRVCAELCIQCIAFNPGKRPDAKHMIDRLDDVNIMDRSIKSGVSGTSTVAQAREASDAMQQGDTRSKICPGGEEDLGRHHAKLMDVYGKTGAAESKSEIKVHIHCIPNEGEPSVARVAKQDEASKHHILESMLCDESIEPACLELSLLEDITNNFSSDYEIARSPSGVFYKGQLSNGSTVVVKRLAFAFAIDDKLFLHAVNSLMSVKHSNIVRFLGYCGIAQEEEAKEGGKTVMVIMRKRLLCFEYLPNGNLEMHLTDESHGFDWHARYRTIKGICQGLYYLHNNFISLLDLKPENILFDKKMMPKILNDGFSRVFSEEIRRTILKNVDGSLAYMATPEYLAGGDITFKSDIYSLGLIIMQIVTGQNKKNYSYEESVKIVQSWRSRLELDVSKGGHTFETCYQQAKVCIEIGIRCMDNDPANRPIPRYVIDRLHKMEAEHSFRSDGSNSMPQATLPLQSTGNKMVLKVPVMGKKGKRPIMQSVSKIEGINSLAFDDDKNMLTVVGNVDTAEVLTALGEKHQAQVITEGIAEKVQADAYCTIM